MSGTCLLSVCPTTGQESHLFHPLPHAQGPAWGLHTGGADHYFLHSGSGMSPALEKHVSEEDFYSTFSSLSCLPGPLRFPVGDLPGSELRGSRGGFTIHPWERSATPDFPSSGRSTSSPGPTLQARGSFLTRSATVLPAGWGPRHIQASMSSRSSPLSSMLMAFRPAQAYSQKPDSS